VVFLGRPELYEIMKWLCERAGARANQPTRDDNWHQHDNVFMVLSRLLGHLINSLTVQFNGLRVIRHAHRE
jgi:hypothetical protein